METGGQGYPSSTQHPEARVISAATISSPSSLQEPHAPPHLPDRHCSSWHPIRPGSMLRL